MAGSLATARTGGFHAHAFCFLRGATAGLLARLSRHTAGFVVNAQQQAHGHTADDQTAAAVTHQWEGQALGWQQTDIHTHIDKGLQRQPDADAIGEVSSKKVAGLLGLGGDFQRTEKQRGIEQHHKGDADKTQLLGQHGEKEVGMRLGQIEQLLHAAAQTVAEPATGADGDQ